MAVGEWGLPLGRVALVGEEELACGSDMGAVARVEFLARRIGVQ